MNAPRYMLGSSLCTEDQVEALRRFVHRYTGDHTPDWLVQAQRMNAGRKGIGYKLPFKDDAEWLTNTEFRVTMAGRLSRKAKHCHSRPTWPDNPELRRR